MKKIAYLIAYKNFKDEEYFIPKEILEENGIIVEAFSTEEGTAIGVDGGEECVDLLGNIDIDDFDGIIVCGGTGALKYLDNQKTYSLLKEFFDSQKIIGAICIAPTILAKAGILENKKATVWTSSMDKSTIKTLKDNKANYIENSVVVDGKIITADGPSSASIFAEEVVENMVLPEEF